MAAPPKITPDYLAPYFEAVRNGNTQHDAADLCGVSEQTIRNARKRLWFLEAERKARADAVSERVAVIKQAHTKGNWYAAAWWLERRRPDDWKLRDEHHVTGDAARPIGLRIVESRDAVAAALTFGPEPHRAAPGPQAGAGDGTSLGQDDAGGDVGA